MLAVKLSAGSLASIRNARFRVYEVYVRTAARDVLRPVGLYTLPLSRLSVFVVLGRAQELG